MTAFRIDTDSDFATPHGQDEAALKRFPIPIESLGNYPDLVTYDENGREIGRVPTFPK